MRFLVAECQRIVRYQFEAGNELSDKAEAVVKFNAVLFGLVLTAIGLASKSDVAMPVWMPAWAGILLATIGPLALFASMLCAALGFQAVDFEIGLFEDKLSEVLSYNVKEPELLAKTIQSYTFGIAENRASINKVEGFIGASLVLLAAGAGLTLTTGLITWLGH